MQTATSAKRIVAFYGYKGGAGRSLLAANVASVLALSGRRVLVIDWDLEAPGIGDFFDIDKSEQIPEAWRRNAGVFDLLGDCARKAPSDVLEIINAYLDTSKVSPGLIKVRLTGRGDASPSLDLLGPGRQPNAPDLMSSSWPRFFDTHGGQFHAAFRKSVADKKYDHVIIDTRTGFVLPTLFALRYLADDVFLVTPKTHQAIDGLSRMCRLSKATRGEVPEPEMQVMLGRFTWSQYKGDEDEAEEALEALFGHKSAYQFPETPDISDREQLFFNNPKLREVFFSHRGTTDDALEAYRKSFWRLCAKIAGENLDDLAWDHLWGAKPYSDFQDSKGLTEFTGTVPLSDGKARIVAYLDRVGAEPRRGAIKQADSHQRDPAYEPLATWYRSASPFQRSTLREFARNELKTRGIHEEELPKSVQNLLKLDLDVAVESPIEIEEPEPKRPDAHNKPAPTLTIAFKAQISRIARLWKNGSDAAHQDDHPIRALNLFSEAIEIADNLQQKHMQLDASSRREVGINRALSVWEHALALADISNWEQSIREILDLLSSDDIVQDRDAQDKRSVAVFDLHEVLLGLECNRLRSLGPPLSHETAVAMDHITSRMKVDPQRYPEADVLLKEFRALTAQAKPDTKADEILRLFAELADAQYQSRGTSISRLARCAATLAILATRSENLHWRGRLEAVLNEARRLAESSFSTKGSPASANDRYELAGVLLSCGRWMEAKSMLEDAVQLLGASEDGASAFLRSTAAVSIGLAVSYAGRPDLAMPTWIQARDALSAMKPPLGSRREQLRRSLSWWPPCAKYEMGEYDPAWEELTTAKQSCENQLQDELLGPAATWTQSRAESDLSSIRSWMAAVAFARGEFAVAASIADAWEKDLQRGYFLEIEASRRLALCRWFQASASFAASGDENAAKELIANGLAANQRSAEIFGSSAALVQAELVLLREEINAFGSGKIHPEQILRAWENLKLIASVAFTDGAAEQWFYGTQIRISMAIATVSAILLKAGHFNEAVKAAREVIEVGLNIPPNDGQEDGLEWVSRLSALPRSIALWVLAALSNDESDRQAAVKASHDLSRAMKQRYRRIFQFCSGNNC